MVWRLMDLLLLSNAAKLMPIKKEMQIVIDAGSQMHYNVMANEYTLISHAICIRR